MTYRDFKGTMRPSQSKQRSRGRGNNPNNPNGRQRMPNRQQTFDSNGPNIKIRGSAYQVFERYIALAREAGASGDRIAAENLYQHAEHYFRVMNANGEGPQQHRQMTPADTDGALPFDADPNNSGQAQEADGVQPGTAPDPLM